ncbi:MAG: sulfotransferase [Erythrobacter sp.]|nr:MAG: sulfotransferase [Erythrobacter sp.]
MLNGTVPSHPGLYRPKELIADGKYELAAQSLIEFLRHNHDNPQALALLGEAANRLGALGQAEHFLRKAIKLGAREFDIRHMLASVINQQARPALAIPMFEELLEERPDPNTRLVLASIYEKTAQQDKSREIFRDLADTHANNPQVWISYGHSLRADGMVQDAVAAYRRAIAIDDGFGDAWWGLASIKSRILVDEDIATMRTALAMAADDRHRAPLHFAMARAFHDHAEYEEAFAHYKIGNQIRAASLNYNPAELTEEIREIELRIDQAFMRGLPKDPVGEGTPIFVVSLPRSGSTLLEQMLGSHSQIEPVGELPYIPAILRGFMEMATRRGKMTVPQAITAMSPEQASDFGREYLERANLHRRFGKQLFIDKLPHNWSNILFIRKILPQARFIDIRRSGMDCCFSNFTQSFTSAHPASFTLEDVGRSYVDNVRLHTHLDLVSPGMVHHIDYRKLVENPQEQIGSALQYLDIGWEDAVLDFHKLDRVVRTPSSEQVRRPLNRDGIAIWKPYSQWLGPLRDALGSFAEG